MAPHNKRTNARFGALAALALVSTAVLAGCTSWDGGSGNRAPVAALDADRTRAWAGEEFTFDAQASRDADGNVTRWVFDFGDGNRTTVQDVDDARVKHAYAQGGQYDVTVTVVDDGKGDGLQKEDDEASVQVAVDENHVLTPALVTAVPAAGANQTDSQSVMVRYGAERAEGNLSLQGALLAGTSEVQVLLKDPSGNVLVDETVTLTGTQSRPLEFDVPLAEAGTYTLVVEAKSGAARMTGELDIIYALTQ
ncbi:MAG: PKD domain-containing protein [Candidatus Thermoplasmatota archaeon]|jgi:PKD repeat protein